MSKVADKRKLVFHHIPKTGGTTMISLLTQRYDLNEMCNQEWFGTLGRNIRKNHILDQFGELEKFKFIYGHFSANAFSKGFEEYFRFTILRNPHNRIHSLYNDWKSKSEESLKNATTLDKVTAKNAKIFGLTDFLNLRTYPINALFDNGQTRLLSGAMEVEEVTISHFERAKKNLDDLNFVGITEMLSTCYMALCTKMNWDKPSYIPKLNEGSQQNSQVDSTIQKMSHWDWQLYTYAQQKCNEDLFRILGVTEKKELLPHLQPTEVFELDMTMGYEGEGWHIREGIGTEKIWRWTGPGKTSTIRLNLIPKTFSYQLQMHIISVIDQEIVNEMNLYFNSKAISWEHMGIKNGEQIIKACIPDYLIKHNEDTLLIELPYTIAHSDRDASIDDARKKGIAVTRITIKNDI